MPGDDLNTLPLEDDGSYESAVASMPDLMADDPKDFDQATGRPIAPRADDGKFKAKDEPAPKEAEPEAKAEPEKEAGAEEDESDYIEIPSDKEGEQPVRLKVDDAVEAWHKTKSLETELAQAREAHAPPLPHEIEEHVIGLQKERAAVVQAMQQWKSLNAPREPNLDLSNPQSPNYNPELFFSQVQEYQRQLAYHANVDKRIAAANEQTKTERETLRASKVARESAEVRKIWPEVLADEKTRVAAKKALFDHYKIDDDFLDSDITLDHRIYALAKDALAFRALQGKQAEAVKAVKVKPKLIQSQARSAPSSSKNAKAADAFRSLTQTGSIEDAAEALAGLL